jgi:hypothetical protein
VKGNSFAGMVGIGVDPTLVINSGGLDVEVSTGCEVEVVVTSGEVVEVVEAVVLVVEEVEGTASNLIEARQ